MKELKDVISECWHQTPSQRPTFEVALKRIDGIKEFIIETRVNYNF
jgi:hypothetical protein